MSYCHKCGSERPVNAQFCQDCGAKLGKLHTPVVPYRKTKPRPKNRLGIGVAVGVLLFGFIGAVMDGRDDSESEVISQATATPIVSIMNTPRPTPRGLVLNSSSTAPVATPTSAFSSGRGSATASPTVRPTATPTSQLQAAFRSDVTIPDGTVFRPGEVFSKVWKVRNDSNVAWDKDVSLCHVEGTNIAKAAKYVVPYTGPGEDVEISISMIAPTKPGEYTTYWQFCRGDEHFGPKMYAAIVVKSLVPTILPTIPPTSLPVLAADPIPPPPPQPRACCKTCRKGKACGNSCIAKNKTCHQPPGCACDG